MINISITAIEHKECCTLQLMVITYIVIIVHNATYNSAYKISSSSLGIVLTDVGNHVSLLIWSLAIFHQLSWNLDIEHILLYTSETGSMNKE